MKNRLIKQRAILYTCTIFTICTLYAAQPIQPLFENELNLSRFQAVIFTTAIMLPLGIAPIFYGFLLETLSAKQMLRRAVLTLGILEIIFSLSDNYIVLVSLRGVQGFLIPAILTALMSYIAHVAPQKQVQQAISTYIGITIIGGFLGRFFSGLLSDFYGWRPFFMILGISLVGVFFLLNYLSKDVKPNFVKPKLSQVLYVLKKPYNLYSYLAMFTIFFAFQGVLNFIPFELQKIQDGFNGAKIGLVYAGYAIGLIVALNAMKIIKIFKSEVKAMLVGSIIYLISLQIFHAQNYLSMFGDMFLFCLGMFIVHSIATGFINKMADTSKGIANGLYISFYYAGGTLGSFAPGVIYENLGWHWFLGFLSIMVFGGFLALVKLKNSL